MEPVTVCTHQALQPYNMVVVGSVSVYAARALLVVSLCGCAGSGAQSIASPTASSASSPSPLATPSPSSALIVVADTDSNGVTHNLKLYGLNGKLSSTFPLKANVWPLAASGRRIFVQSSNRLKAIDRTGSVQDLGPLVLAPNEIASIVPSPDGTHWLQSIGGNIHEAGDGMPDRVVARGTKDSPLHVYAWTSTGVLISHFPSFNFGIEAPPIFLPRWYVISLDKLDLKSGALTPLVGSAQCKPGDVSAQGVFACFVAGSNDSSNAARLLRLIPRTGKPIDVQLPKPLFTEAGAAWFAPSGEALTLSGWDGNGHFGYPGQPPAVPPVGVRSYLVDLAGKIVPFGPAGAQPALDAHTWLPDGRILLQRKVGAIGGDPGLFILNATGQGPFVKEPGYPIGYIS